MSETLKDIAFDLANRLTYANAKLDYVGLSGYDCIKQYSQDVEGFAKSIFTSSNSALKQQKQKLNHHVMNCSG